MVGDAADMDTRQTLNIRSPHATRPWQHVLEPLSGYLMLPERLYVQGMPFAEAWNFGSYDEDARSVGWIVGRMAEIRQDVKWQFDDTLQPHEANYLKLDSSKAKCRLSWHPQWHLQTAPPQTLEWHQAWHNGDDMRAITLAQVAKYEQRPS